MERKKLLILGGSFYLLPLIEKAHELGVYVITADYLPDNAAHKYADEYHNVSVIDKEAVLNLAKELKIDGVTAFVNDIAATTAAYVAEKLGLNFQCPYESAVILQDKGKFRKFLSDNGFNSPHSKRYDDVNAPMNDIDYFDWPVIVKPTDSCGSRGVTKVEKPEDLPSAIKEAVDNCTELLLSKISFRLKVAIRVRIRLQSTVSWCLMFIQTNCLMLILKIHMHRHRLFGRLQWKRNIKTN